MERAQEWAERGASPAERRQPSAWVGLGAAAVVVAFFAWRGFVVPAVVVAVLAVGLTVARHRSPAFDRRAGRVLHAVSHWVGVVLTVVLLGMLTLLLILPVWLVGRVLRWDALQPAPSQRGQWDAHTVRRAPRKLDRRLFALEPRRRGWTAVHGLVVVVVPVVLVAMVAWGAVVRLRPTAATPPATSGGLLASGPYPGAFADAPWQSDLQRDQGGTQARYDAVLGWRGPTEYTSQYVNVHEGARASYVPANLGADPLEVWFFGGSTMFGYGQRDDHTIVSGIVERAEADGIPIDARNFGVVAYTNWQEAEWLTELLTTRPPPDLIVFYDGKNDVGNYVYPGQPQHLWTQFGSEVQQALIDAGARFLPDDRPVNQVPSPENAARIYNQGVQFSHRIAGSYGVPIVTYFQPNLYTRDLPVDDDVITYANLGDVSDDRALYDQVRALLDPAVHDVADCLDALDAEVYWDDVHHNERGADAIAGCVYDDLAPQLRELATG
ncbi:MAG: SGNH/GDSL hydrolase family protein [Acidimicrobiales bacterium]|nr:SGNH/GDSL hydrolase family protein [Acidimicrobiales bacterium]